MHQLPIGPATATAPRLGPSAFRLARSLSVVVCGALVVAFAGISAAASSEAPVPHKVIVLSVVKGAVPDLGDTVRVKQGDELELKWSSDKPMELHLHGYDIEVKVSPQAPAVMSFKAAIPGRFPIEAHGSGSHRPVVYLEVYP